MRSHVGRLYAIAATLLVCCLSWALIVSGSSRTGTAAATQDPRLDRLAAREAALTREAARVQRVLDKRWAAYQVKLADRRQQIADAKQQAQLASQQAAPQVQVVQLPPVTSTASS